LFVHFSSPFTLTVVHFVRKHSKSRVLGVLRLFAALLRTGSSTQKGTVFPFLFVLSTRFAFQVSSPVAAHNRSIRLNFQPITKFNASLERKLPSISGTKKTKGDQPARETEVCTEETKCDQGGAVE